MKIVYWILGIAIVLGLVWLFIPLYGKNGRTRFDDLIGKKYDIKSA